jgi:hypothetical protein
MQTRMALIEQSIAQYLTQLDGMDRKETPSTLRQVARLKERITTLKQEMRRLRVLKVRMEASPDGQVSLIDPDARSMASQGKRTGIVGYNVQTAVDTKNHLIVTHEVTNVGSDRTAEHPFGTIKSWMGATHFLCRTLPKVSAEMSLHVLAYNLKRVMRIMGTGALMEALQI